MGLFGKKNNDIQDDVVVPSSGLSDSMGIDFSAYDLTSLGDDIRSVVDLPTAIAKTAKWALGLPVLVGIVSWLVFAGRMASWVLVPFVLIAIALAVIASVLVGGYLVTRKRLDTVSEATNRVVTVVGEMHADVVQIRDGHASTSIQQVATGLLEHAIFPVVFGFVGVSDESTGIVGKVMSRASGAPMKLVQKSVIAAVGRLPDREIGSYLDDVTDSLPQTTSILAELNAQYTKVATGIDGVVGGVSKVALRSVMSAGAVAALPLLFWLALGWIAS